MPSYLEIARRALQKSPLTEARECERSELSEKRIQRPLSPGAKDPYQTAAEEALRAICDPDYPAGMILWLERANPRVYAELTERLPDEIHRLWSEHAPLPKFQDVLDRWKQTHAQACVLYRAHLAARKPGEADQCRLFCRRAVHGAG